ncbi:hypothetical protein [Aeromonas hydrophila]|jgi:hypothetical protein|uniref:hypothetical protein n=1 Tax=Aeromonas hydrophila TaxID=644 RepID=UPI002929C2E8|nr:hypothetical protein [Aeromonas hydrophila]
MRSYTLAEAVRDLFGFKLADYPKLKDQLNSLVRNKLIHMDADLISHRNRRLLPELELTTLFNATLLLALFPDPAKVKLIFDDVEERQKAARLADLIVINRQSLLEIIHLNVNAAIFVNVLATPDIDLRKHRLDNPFEILPQILLKGDVGLVDCNVARSASLTKGDSMLRCYLDGELDIAAQHAVRIILAAEKEPSELVKLARHIEVEFGAAKEFSETVDLLFGRAF